MTTTDPSPPAERSSDEDPLDHFVQLAHLAAIVESSDDAIVSKTLEGRILSWNRGAARIFGYQPHEVIGKPITVIIPPELHEEERQILERLRRGERIDHFDTMRVAKDGRRIPISLTVSPIRNSRGVIVGASKVARDISERRRAEEAVREREEALREADRRKDEFIALVAHELRNPLAPIRYALAASKKAGTLELHRQMSEIVERQVAHMSRLLEDLLDISRITRGSLEIKKAPTELTYILGLAIETARPLMKAKHHELSLDLTKYSIPLQADSVRLAQVFSNLLINAAKYTDPGGRIQLRAEQKDGEVVVTIGDNGTGIPADLMPRLFELYSQGPGAARRAEGGLGIGLSLVRGLVALHGGRVQARSEGPGKGSEFVVRLPLEEVSATTAASAPAEEQIPLGDCLKVLVIDDNRDAADTCAMLLEMSGHHVQTAYTGRGGLELAEGLRPHAIVMDISLPDIDGYQLAQKVRTSDWGAAIVLVAVTGWGKEEDRQRAFTAGFDYHLTKPIAVETLESLLQSVALMRRPASRDRSAEASKRPS